MGDSDAEYLFRDYDIYAVQEHQRRQLAETIDAADALVIRSTEVDELVVAYTRQFRLDVPELTEGAISVEVEEAQVDASGDFRFAFIDPGPHYVPGIRATYYVPYVGDGEMFRCKPSSWTTVIPAAEITDHELKFTFERADENVLATKTAFDEQLSRVKQYLGWLRENADAFNRSLPDEVRQRVTARTARLQQVDKGVQSLGVPIRRAHSAAPIMPSITSTGDSGRSSAALDRYDVALSFAGENRGYVEEVANGLKGSRITVFYDAFEQANLWGKNLVDHLAEIYQKRSRYVVMFISAPYVEKAWTTHERRHAQARALVAKDEYILPVRFDDTEVPGMTNTVAYVDLRKTSPSQLVDLILAKLRNER